MDDIQIFYRLDIKKARLARILGLELLGVVIVEQVAEFGLFFDLLLEHGLGDEGAAPLAPCSGIDITQSHLVVVLVVLDLFPIEVTAAPFIDNLEVLTQPQAQVLLHVASLQAMVVCNVIAFIIVCTLVLRSLNKLRWVLVGGQRQECDI